MSAKILVVAYSRTGTTAKIAAEIAQRSGADLEEIGDVRNRNGVFGYLRSTIEALRGALAPIRPPVRSWRNYDVIVIGTPVWAGHLSSPVRTYLSKQLEPGKRVAFFCTMGGRGAEKVFAELSELTQVTAVATLVLTDAQIAQRAYGDILDVFVKAIAAKNEMPRAAVVEDLRPVSVL